MLPESDWLPKAKRLAVGMTMRVFHGAERRPNMTIGNERDRYWAYCQKCKQGARLDKEHVLLSAHYVAEERQLLAPTDLVPALGNADWELIVGRFLASKGMDYTYLPTLYVSPSTRRLMLHDGVGWHGRDLTEKSNQKWLHYGAQFSGTPGPITVLTEDLFSMFKLRHALKGSPLRHTVYADVCSTLGSLCTPTAALALKDCSTLVWAYDGDTAGDDGFKQASKRMRAFGSKQLRARPPDGLDPKDMELHDLRVMIMEALDATRECSQ